MLEALIDYHETPIGCPWDVKYAEDAMEKNLRGVVGFEIAIEHIEGQFKFNQNRSREDQRGVADALEGSDDPLQRDVAAIMRRNRERSED